MENTIDFDSYRERLRQEKANVEELQIRERELRESLNKQLKVLTDKAALLTQNWEQGNAEFLAVLAEAQTIADETEARLRKHMLDAFAADPTTKQIATGLSIRVDKKYDYDEQDAIKFAIDRKMLEVLAVDKPKFKKLMAIQPQDFVTVKEVPTPVISFKK